MSRGHVFVVHARIGHLDCDAIVVPTDRYFTVEPPWHAALGSEQLSSSAIDELTPRNWPTQRYGRASGQTTQPTWFVDVARYGGEPADELSDVMARLRATLTDIASAGVANASGRVKPLVAIPTLGTGLGGFDAVRGAVIETQLETCQQAVDRLDVDVVIVAAQPADYTAFQRARRAGKQHFDLSPDLVSRAEELATRAVSGELALFVGAGVSMGAGLPSWTELLEQLASQAGVELAGLETSLDKAELLRRKLGDEFGQAVVQAVTGSDRYAIAHSMLATLGCTEVITTNYDTLYEKASADVANETLPVLPYGETLPGQPWLLKMHGDVSRQDAIVLTRSDYVRYDSRSRPLGSVVQALMMTKHLLVVGASLTDDNFLRLAHEVMEFYRSSQDAGAVRRPLGTVIDMSLNRAKELLWEGTFDYVATSTQPDTANQARDLAIFLDLLAALAAPNAHLLDERYAYLLDSQREHDAVDAARRLRAQISELGSEWGTLIHALDRLGPPS
ncbi:SIR2 family protein [Georgenia sunbinii]|uniref:SIR2 family protein n=1 Tax=Georgenia sunbinii TaxID=3117728 RepID=UPI002F269BA5